MVALDTQHGEHGDRRRGRRACRGWELGSVHSAEIARFKHQDIGTQQQHTNHRHQFDNDRDHFVHGRKYAHRKY